MKFIERIIYKDVISKDYVADVDAFVKELATDLVNPINYFFELYETDEVIVFVNLYAFDLKEGENSRIFQVETASVDKKTLKIVNHGDNTGLDSYNTLNDCPVWTLESLAEQGIERGDEASFGYKFGHIEW